MPTLVQSQYLGDLKVAYPSVLGDLSAEQINGLSVSAASRFIDEFKAALTERWGFKAGTRQSACAQALYAANGDVEKAYRALVNGVGRVKALTFYRNPSPSEKRAGMTARQPLSFGEQRDQLRKTLHAVQPEVRLRLQNPEVVVLMIQLPSGEQVGEDSSGGSESQSQQQQGQNDPSSADPQQSQPESGEAEGFEPENWESGEAESGDPVEATPELAPEPEPEVVCNDCGRTADEPECHCGESAEQTAEREAKEAKQEFDRQAKSLEQNIDKLRDFCQGRNADGSVFDTIGNRPYENGGAMLGAGFPEDAILYAATLHWPEGDRQTAGAPKEYDQSRVFLNEGNAAVAEGKHPMFPYVYRSAVVARQPTAMTGEPGGGKTFLARQLADELGLPFGMIPLTGGATPSWLAGAYTMDMDQPYKNRPFTEVYGSGGVFLFDELDAGDPNMLLMVNAALANGEFHNPVTGKTIVQHDDFIPLAGMNTLGLGANRHMTGRERLDGATLDRWRMGRVELGLDKRIAHSILRKKAAEAAARLTA